MSDKQKVLAVFPGAYCEEQFSTNGPRYGWAVFIGLKRISGYHEREDEAWKEIAPEEKK